MADIDVTRRVMQFLVPTTIDALNRDDTVGRSIIPFYINPQSFSIQETKIINENLTKGGYVVQYWGEELPVIQASGTTGSGSIEAVNILRDVYRHEQIQFKTILDSRSKELADEAAAALNNTAGATVSAGVGNVLDTITDGGFSGIVDGISSSIEAITNAATGIVESNRNRVELIPSLAAFAVSIDLYWQDEYFRGYFTSFSVDENASTPGLFDYQFSFKVIKRSGRRNNFMPWSRSPTDFSGQPRTASTPKEGVRTDELSFETTQERLQIAFTAAVVPDQSGPTNIDDILELQTATSVPLNRNQSTGG